MPEPFYFLCYSSLDLARAIKLADQLIKGPPSIAVWLDKRKIQPGIDWDFQIAEALSTCAGVLYLMSEDSVSDTSECQQEWKRALTYKKPIIPLLFEKSATMPYRLAPRQYIDFTGSFEVGLAKLRNHLRWRGTDEGALHALKERLEDAKRDLKRASEGEAARIREEIGDLKQQIERQRAIIADPEAAKQRADESINRGIEREKAPAKPITPEAKTKFINRLPMIPPLYFQDRHVETGLIGEFLKDESQRLMTVVGRGGVGKTAMVCRLLKALEAERLPDNGGELSVDGIVYLSARAGRPVNYANLFADLCRLAQ